MLLSGMLTTEGHGAKRVSVHPVIPSGPVPGYSGTRVHGPNVPAGFASDPNLVTVTTRPGKPTGYPGPTQTSPP